MRIRTANEEQAALFRSATVCEPPKTVFAVNIQRALKASLAVCGYDSNIEISHSENPYVEMMIDSQRRTLVLNRKWTDINAAHDRYVLAECSILSHEIFACDHIIEELFTMYQDQVSKFAPSVMTYYRRRREWRLIRGKVRQMPRNVTLHSGTPSTFGKLGLLVTWEDGETLYVVKRCGHQKVYHVVLHEERCSVQNNLLHGERGRFTPPCC